MGENKFRAWDELNKVMHYNFEYISSGNEDNDWIIFKSDKQKLEDRNVLNNPYCRKQFHIMKFTGVIDKDGKEIYENDVIEYLDGKKYLVVWDEYRFNLKGFYDSYFDCPTDAFSEGVFKVIGNIYENPKLLKQVEEV